MPSNYAAHPLCQHGLSADQVEALANQGVDLEGLRRTAASLPPGWWQKILEIILQILGGLNPPAPAPTP